MKDKITKWMEFWKIDPKKEIGSFMFKTAVIGPITFMVGIVGYWVLHIPIIATVLLACCAMILATAIIWKSEQKQAVAIEPDRTAPIKALLQELLDRSPLTEPTFHHECAKDWLFEVRAVLCHLRGGKESEFYGCCINMGNDPTVIAQAEIWIRALLPTITNAMVKDGTEGERSGFGR